MPPIVVTVEHDVAAPIDAVWAVLGDTDRFNRASGMGFRYELRDLPDGRTERIGMATKFGLTLRWTERPWTFEAPDGFYVRRDFHGGPLDHYTVVVRLQETASGTHFTYTLTLHPTWWGWPLLAIEAATDTGPKLRTWLAAAVHILEGRSVAFDPPPPPLSTEAQARLTQGLARVPAAIREPLQQHIGCAPLAQQRRMSPIVLSRAFALPLDTLVDGLITAVHDGALKARWELRCPQCRGAAATLTSLSAQRDLIHCPTCEIRFDATFPESVAVVFEPAAGVRDVDEPVACAISPRRTPHVHASIAVAAGGDAEVTIALAAGTYRVRSVGDAHGLIVVDAESTDTVAAFRLDAGGVSPPVVRLAPGRCVLAIDSGLAIEASFVVEARWTDPDVYPLARLLETEAGRALLGVVDPSAAIGIAARGAMLALSVAALGRRSRTVVDAVIAAAPRWWRADDDLVFALFDRFDQALDVAAEVAADLRVGAALDVGLWFDAAGTPGGNTVASAIDAARRVGFGRVVVPEARTTDPEITAALAARGLAFGPIPWTTYRPIRLQRRPLPAPPPVAAGDRLGRWKLVAPISSGSQGAVWDAIDDSGARAAVKVLLHVGALDPGALQRFWLEARLLGRVKHNNLVRIFDWGTDDAERPFIAMARLEGHDLHTQLTKGPLEPRRAATWAAGLADGLGALHDANILHRDLKPANVFLVRIPSIKPAAHQPILIDLGVAQDLARADADRGQTAGTPRYMAPEQLAGEAMSPAADVFALGLVLFDCLTGELPWDREGDDNAAISSRLRVLAPAVGSRTHQPIPRPLSEIIAKALARDPTERYADGRAMAAALREFLERWYR